MSMSTYSGDRANGGTTLTHISGTRSCLKSPRNAFRSITNDLLSVRARSACQQTDWQMCRAFHGVKKIHDVIRLWHSIRQ